MEGKLHMDNGLHKPQVLKGFRDFLPEAAWKRQWLKNKMIGVVSSWGYEPLETPTLEPLELFAGQIGEDEKLFFSFEDNGGRKVALRYDQTVPTCRVLGEYAHTLVFPFRRYQVQSAFRAEKPQKGRYREFTQFDIDIFGVTAATADAEVIAVTLDIYRQLGFKTATALINSRSLMVGIPYEAIVAIDKLAKIGKDGVIADMTNKGISQVDAERYFEQVMNLKPNEEIQTIFSYLEKYGFSSDWYRFEPTLARSFSYSEGPIWEIVIPEYGTGSVGGGERYDSLIEKVSGQKISGTGIGIGFDRTLEAAEACGLMPVYTSSTKVLITSFSNELYATSNTVSQTIRATGISAELYPDATAKLDKQLKYADRKKIPFVVIIGPEEAEKGVVQVKNMTTRESTTVKMEDVASSIK